MFTIFANEHPFRTNFRKRREDKGSLKHAGMRQGEPRMGNVQVVAIKKIEIYCAGLVKAMRCWTPQRDLDCLQAREQIQRRKPRRKFHHCVQEICRARRTIHGSGFKHCGKKKRSLTIVQGAQPVHCCL